MSWVTTITVDGNRLIANTPGHMLRYTRAACSSKPTPADQVKDMVELAEYAMDLSIVEYHSKDDVALLRLQLDNSTVTSPFNLYQIGVFAQLFDSEGNPATKETLVMVIQDEENPDYIRTNPQATEYLVNTIIGQCEHLEVNLNLAAYVSVALFRDLRLTVEQLKEQVRVLEQEMLIYLQERYTNEDIDNFLEFHTHSVDQIKDFPQSLPAEGGTADAVPWSGVTGRPSVFPPETHSHTKSQISDFPTTIAPSAHNHGAGDINSGTLAVARGGTGQTSVQAFRNSMGLGNTTGALPIANGGTGAATAAAALTNLGAYSKAQVDSALANKANSGSPTQTSLNPSSGVTGAIVYYKNEFNQVIVIFDCSSSSSSGVPNRTAFATMPSGYRARTKFSTPIVMQTVAGNTTQFGFVDVQTNGSIVLDTTANSAYATRWFGAVTYYTT